jgi:hypothetical protein
MIPGLDTAIIPAPLAGTRPDKTDTQPGAAAPTPAAPPIDDPDGVLETH